MNQQDIQLERGIDKATYALVYGHTKQDRRDAFELMRALIASRRPEVVREMESKKGLTQ